MSSTDWVAEAVRYGHDGLAGAEIEQLTGEPVTSTNIYCEQRFASADGHRIAIARLPFGHPAEIWVADLRSMRIRRMAEGIPLAANAATNAVFFLARNRTERRLFRLDLSDLTIRDLLSMDDSDMIMNGTVSPDERWLIYGPFAEGGNVYSLKRVDIATGRADTLCTIEAMFNPHLQFDPGQGRISIVQINRGGRRNPATGKLVLGSTLGATLALVDVETGAVTPLPVGRPHTPGLSGHECWAGRSGRILFTAGQYKVSSSAHVTLRDPPEPERAMPPAAIYGLTPGDARAQVVAHGLLFNHLAASDDGRYFVADDHVTGRIYIGNLDTGAYLPLCDSHARQGAGQPSHAHAYLTPDNMHVIFNSTATGCAQVYAARVPDGFLDAVRQASPA